LHDTERGDQGFGSSNTTIDQGVKGQEAKPKMEINEISARAFGQFYRRGETTGILRWDEVDNEIQLEAINISTELAIKNKRNSEDQDVRDSVPREYHHLLDVFEKEKKRQYHPTDQVLIWESTWKKEKQYPPRKYTPSVTTSWKSSIDTSNKMRKGDGLEG